MTEGKNSRVYGAINEDIKKDSEKLFKALGLSMSDAIGLFLHQIVFSKGIPFEIRSSAKSNIISDKDLNVYGRINKKTKEDAEIVLQKLGLSMSDAIGLFLLEAVRIQGLPFSISIKSFL